LDGGILGRLAFIWRALSAGQRYAALQPAGSASSANSAIAF
jgi:hypothetical protein